MRPRRRALVWAVGLVAACVAASARAQSEPPPVETASRPAPTVQVLAGASREINHAHSASRDTGAMALTLTPYSVLTAGADVALLKWKLNRVSLRLGFFGLIELESDRPFDGHTPDFIPRVNSAFWRPQGGYSVALAFDRWAQATLGQRAAFEIALSLRHESEHFTGSRAGDPPKYGDVPHMGNFAMVDAAVRLPVRNLDVELRFQNKVWLGTRAYSVGPGADVIVRWRRWEWLYPFSATFAEYMFGRRTRWDDGRDVQVPDDYLIRNLTGVAFPGTVGEIQVFTSLEIGHGKGLNVYREEVRWGGGIRLAFY